MRPERSFPWLPVIGALVGLIIIWQVSTQTKQATTALQVTFERQAMLTSTEVALAQTVGALTPRPQISLDDLQRLLPSVVSALPEVVGGLPMSAVLASGVTARTRIDVLALEPNPDGAPGVVVRGTVTNTSAETITVPISVFSLRDSNGNSYAVGAGVQADVLPGEYAPLELTVPVGDDLGLVLVVVFAGEVPIELHLRDARSAQVP